MAASPRSSAQVAALAAGAVAATALAALAWTVSRNGLAALVPRRATRRRMRDFEVDGIRRLHPRMAAYYGYVCGEGQTGRDTRTFLDSLRLVPRILTGDITKVDLSVQLFDGRRPKLPVIIAPTAFHDGATPRAELDTAAGAKAGGATYSYNFFLSSAMMEDVLQQAGEDLWLHLYLFKQRHIVVEAIRAAEATGRFSAIIVTGDHPHDRVKNNMVFNILEFWLRRPFSTLMPNTARLLGMNPKSCTPFNVARNFDAWDSEMPANDSTLSWEDIRWVVQQTKLPVIVKGVLSPEDAELAIAVGAKGIVVSNHGGRQCDCAPPAVELLPEVIDRVAGRCDVFVDSGFRSSMDILKALVLGAKGVLLGRPVLHALACDGARGLSDMFRCIEENLIDDMRAMGVRSVDELTPDLLYWKDRERVYSFKNKAE